jgi:hypothetical protein
VPAKKARPSLVSLAKQIESLTPKTRRIEHGFSYEMRKMKGIVRSELLLVRAEARRQMLNLRLVMAQTARRVRTVLAR